MGRFLVTCSLDACILWDLKDLKRMQNIGSSGRIGAIQTAFLHSGNTLITLSRSEGLYLYHFPTLTLRARLTAMSPGSQGKQKRMQFRCFALTPNRMYIVAATTDTRAYVWHLPSETMVEQLSLPVPCATRAYGSGILQPLVPYASVAMPESSRLAYVGEDGIVRIMDVPSGNVVRSVGVAAHAFAMYKERIAITSADGSVRLSTLSQRARGKSSRERATNVEDKSGFNDQNWADEAAGVENEPANRRRPASARGQRVSSHPHHSASCSDSSSGALAADAQSHQGSFPGGGGGSGGDGGRLRERVIGITEVEVKARAVDASVKRRPHTAHPQNTSPCAVSSSLGTSTDTDVWTDNAATGARLHGARGHAGGKGRAPDGVAGGGMAPNLEDFYKQGILQVKDGTAQETAQMVERLRAFLDVHGTFTEQHRLSVYRQARFVCAYFTTVEICVCVLYRHSTTRELCEHVLLR